MDGVRARYGRQKMLGNAELGYPVLQEAEGLALHNGKLYLLDMDFWCQTADVVSLRGHTLQHVQQIFLAVPR